MKTEKHRQQINNDLDEPPPDDSSCDPFSATPPCNISFATLEFLHKYFPSVTYNQWNNWRWQLANRICTQQRLSEIISLTEHEKSFFNTKNTLLPFAITPYYLSLIADKSCNYALRKTVIPTDLEFAVSFGESEDPLHEEDDCPVPQLIHRYPDRVLLLATDFCSVYCRYCTRSRFVNKQPACHDLSLQPALNYIRNHTQIRDVVISGGDPLCLSDSRLEWILSEIRQIPHVEIVRIGTKVPVVLPSRITNKLVKMLKKYKPVYMSIHVAHPDEITPEMAAACNLLADSGVVMGSQTVLLKGVNDSPDIMKSMYQKLLTIRVRPYYLYQCDPITGSGHFRTLIEDGLRIIEGLRGFTSGYAIPQFIIDSPGGGGKVAILPETIIKKDHNYLHFRNYEGKAYKYPRHTERISSGATVPC
ncbi:MAG: KamA family radical SAM protein [Candidatus Margulisiibacteriota bacterium]